MNKYVLVLALALLSTLAASAQEVYQLKIRGSLISPSGRTRVKETTLVATNGHLLIYEVDLASKSLDLFETFPNLSTFTDHLHTDDTAVDGNKVVMDIHEDTGFSANLAGVPAFTGRLIAKGRVTERSLRFSVIGVWNESTDTVFKGVITGKRLVL
jgi:hypothetical protein